MKQNKKKGGTWLNQMNQVVSSKSTSLRAASRQWTQGTRYNNQDQSSKADFGSLSTDRSATERHPAIEEAYE